MAFDMSTLKDPVNPYWAPDEQPKLAELLELIPDITFDLDDFDASDSQGYIIEGFAYYKGEQVFCHIGIEDGYPTWELSVAECVWGHIHSPSLHKPTNG